MAKLTKLCLWRGRKWNVHLLQKKSKGPHKRQTLIIPRPVIYLRVPFLRIAWCGVHSLRLLLMVGTLLFSLFPLSNEKNCVILSSFWNVKLIPSLEQDRWGTNTPPYLTGETHKLFCVTLMHQHWRVRWIRGSQCEKFAVEISLPCFLLFPLCSWQNPILTPWTR